MIQVAGQWWGTAAEVAEQIGHGLTEDNVRRWAARHDLDSFRVKGTDGRRQVWYSLGQAVAIDRQKRHAGRGRRRSVS